MKRALGIALLIAALGTTTLSAQTNSLWFEAKVKNYLLHMTRPEVEDLLTRTDMVIIPVASLEQHGLHLPIGTDYISGVERAKLIAQRTDALVAPILLPGQSPITWDSRGRRTSSAPPPMRQRRLRR